jgi:hypothetical protein
MYLRDLAKYYLSVAQQALKSHHVLPSPSPLRYEILESINNWRSINAANFTLREFDRACLNKGDVIVDFHEYIKQLGYKFELKLANAKNESMSVEGTVILQEFHRLIRLDDLSEEELNSNIIRARKFRNRASLGTKPILNKRVVEYIYIQKQDEIAYIPDAYGIFKSLFADLLESCNDKDVIKLPKLRLFTDIVSGSSVKNFLELRAKFQSAFL